MRRIIYLTAIILLAGATFMTSCKKEDDDGPPNINFKGGATYISQDATLNTLEAFTIGITASSNTTSGALLTNLNISRTFDNQTWFSWDTALNVDHYDLNVSFLALNVEGVERIAFKVTDENGISEEIGLNITTESVAGPINFFTQKWLGSYDNNDTGSSFASIDGTVYMLADAKVNSEKVDLVYFFGATYGATLASPDDGVAATVFTGVNGLDTWSQRNNTRFKKLDATAIDWADINDDTIIVEQTETGVDSSRISNTEDGLEAGAMLGFITASGKKGMILIDEIIPGSAGSISISVKVQQ